ncbi:MAG: hypothetical protein UCH28_06600, partial [Adlercreutzia sp.]|nr:hypothetical protein [Adlercreutzia sp.]
WEKFKRRGKKLYDRMSGRWMDDMGEHIQPTVLMDKLEIPLADHGPHVKADASPAPSTAEEPAPDPSDRLFVDRDELYAIIGLDREGASPEESERDPFEPQTPEPKKPSHNPRDQKKKQSQKS